MFQNNDLNVENEEKDQEEEDSSIPQRAITKNTKPFLNLHKKTSKNFNRFLEYHKNDEDSDEDSDDYDIIGGGGNDDDDDDDDALNIAESGDNVMDFLDSVISKSNPHQRRSSLGGETEEDLTTGDVQYRPLEKDKDPWAIADKTRSSSSHNLLTGTPLSTIRFSNMHLSSGAINAVQVRNFGDQRNLATTFVRFGAKADQGPCKYMEDRLVSWPHFIQSPEVPLSDIGIEDPTVIPSSLKEIVANIAESSSSNATNSNGNGITPNRRASFGDGFVVPLASAVLKSGSFFAVYDGHAGGEAADQLKDELHGELKRQLVYAAEQPENFLSCISSHGNTSASKSSSISSDSVT
eukprot:CAMPEP_0114381196 /NCGR_PEP_ID=MMETSP0102-20121206/3310_1 /TAXON_ID=38822 ORGANISM="Pteridomonas danica, Strain PT" /NCGR_SAMPLE_ID=MMETSP0102 /ASSEMBLY_ACC=CAM_ASM_000212 /LENGTH=350 /DNA_ID=CAMNT_0001536641 /DNA_START=1723 /DNA_END=2771 /DNA_ORIENTATION=+